MANACWDDQTEVKPHSKCSQGQAVFGFLRKIGSPDFGREVIKASYEKHYKLANARGVEPFPAAIVSTLGSRYQITRKLKPEPMLWIESVPFIMMGFPKGLEMLSDYLIGQEIKNFDIGEVSRAINNALIGPRNNETSDDAYNLLTSGLPYLEGAGISWMAWLNEATSKNLMADAVADLDKMK